VSLRPPGRNTEEITVEQYYDRRIHSKWPFGFYSLEPYERAVTDGTLVVSYAKDCELDERKQPAKTSKAHPSAVGTLGAGGGGSRDERKARMWSDQELSEWRTWMFSGPIRSQLRLLGERLPFSGAAEESGQELVATPFDYIKAGGVCSWPCGEGEQTQDL